jgi:hypothetical protein
MPTYQCLDTEVQLCTWTPLLRYLTASSATNTRIPQSLNIKGLVPGTNPGDRKDSWVNEVQGNSDDPAWPWKVTRLNEEYFKGHEGLDFLGMDMPFYLIHARGDLYSERTSLPGRAALQKQKSPEQEAIWKVFSTSTGSSLSNTASSLFRSVRNTSSPSPMPKEDFSPQMYDLNAPPYGPSVPNLLVLPSLESPPPYSNLGIKQLTSGSVSKSRNACYTHSHTKAE